MPKRRADEAGFLLLEVLVAFVIASLALAVLFQGIVAGMRATNLAGRYEQATARARSHLAAFGGLAQRLTPGIQSGDDGSAFRWQVQVAPEASLTLAGPPAQEVVLYRVSVTESWSDGDGGRRAVRLVTARLATEAPSGAPSGP